MSLHGCDIQELLIILLDLFIAHAF